MITQSKKNHGYNGINGIMVLNNHSYKLLKMYHDFFLSKRLKTGNKIKSPLIILSYFFPNSYYIICLSHCCFKLTQSERGFEERWCNEPKDI